MNGTNEKNQMIWSTESLISSKLISPEWKANARIKNQKRIERSHARAKKNAFEKSETEFCAGITFFWWCCFGYDTYSILLTSKIPSRAVADLNRMRSFSICRSFDRFSEREENEENRNDTDWLFWLRSLHDRNDKQGNHLQVIHLRTHQSTAKNVCHEGASTDWQHINDKCDPVILFRVSRILVRFVGAIQFRAQETTFKCILRSHEKETKT